MARTSKTAPSTSTAVTNWDEELAKQAEVAAGMEANSGGGSFFSMKSGVLSFNGSPMPGNQMAVVILDTIMENVLYVGQYDANNPTPPTCFAFGRSEEEMTPHKIVKEAGQAVSDMCKTCPNNEWASATTGKGKACRNTRRLAMIPAGAFDKDGRFKANDTDDHFVEAAIAYMKLPVTSIKAYAGFVKSVSGVLKRPPHGIFTRVKVEPDPKTQFRVLFEPLGPIPNNLIPFVMKRNEEAKSLIDFPYTIDTEQKPEPVKTGRGPVTAKTAAPARRKY